MSVCQSFNGYEDYKLIFNQSFPTNQYDISSKTFRAQKNDKNTFEYLKRLKRKMLQMRKNSSFILLHCLYFYQIKKKKKKIV